MTAKSDDKGDDIPESRLPVYILSTESQSHVGHSKCDCLWNIMEQYRRTVLRHRVIRTWKGLVDLEESGPGHVLGHVTSHMLSHVLNHMTGSCST